MDVDHEPVFPRGVEDLVELRATGLVVGPSTEQETGLEGLHTLLAGVREGGGVEVGILRSG